jgi:UDP-N-acetylglucosamine 1-carboxyvinyltransferase
MPYRMSIEGGVALSGQVRISGAKNAVLPILCGAILASDRVHIHNVPDLMDVKTNLALLAQMGAQCSALQDGSVSVDPSSMHSTVAPYELVKTMRASILVLGPLLAKFGHAEVSLPGGCAIGARPVNLHIKAMEALGAKVEVEGGYIRARADRLVGARIVMEMVTVTGTENALMAACLAEGTSVIENAAQEPEVVDLIDFLNTLGAKISGAGTNTLTVHGVQSLSGGSFSVQPDRIETGTFLVAAAMTQGHVRTTHTRAQMLDAVLQKLREAGATITTGDADQGFIELDMRGRRARAVDVTTAPYPAFPTDMQAQLCALNCVAEGVGTITETVFENRMMHIPELMRLGADIRLHGHSATIHGVPQLSGAPMMATDLRASASLVLAALAAKGESVIDRIYHIDRGYEHIETKLAGLGAKIRRL